MPQETGTLAELDVKPGDVVKWNGSDSPYTAQEMPDPNDKRKLWAKNDGGWIGDEARCRIISRATQPDKPKTWGEMTDAEKLAQEWTVCTYEAWQNLDLDAYEAKEVVGADLFVYRIKPEPVVETVTLHGRKYITDTFPQGVWDMDRNDKQPGDTHALTFTTRDGEPATGRYVNEAGDVITLERIGGDA